MKLVTLEESRAAFAACEKQIARGSWEGVVNNRNQYVYRFLIALGHHVRELAITNTLAAGREKPELTHLVDWDTPSRSPNRMLLGFFDRFEYADAYNPEAPLCSEAPCLVCLCYEYPDGGAGTLSGGARCASDLVLARFHGTDNGFRDADIAATHDYAYRTLEKNLESLRRRQQLLDSQP